jgi:hypothetical protein
VKHNQASGIAVLFLDANPHPRRFSTFPEFGEVLEPFARPPRERNVRGCRVKEVQPRLADERQIQRTIERSFAGLLEIDCAQNSSDGRHAVSTLIRG